MKTEIDIKSKSKQENDMNLILVSTSTPNPSGTGNSTNMLQGSKDFNPQLMDRLASGKRTVVNKKEMKKLTRQNYQNLPEIKRKKDEERKKLEA